jgi:TRAP-type mannitol/chloroaromatic compound transport system permease small subunit
MLSNFSFRQFINYLALASAFSGAVYVLNNFITFVFDMPGLFGTLSMIGFDLEAPETNGAMAAIIGIFQSSLYLLAIILPFFVLRRQSLGMREVASLDRGAEAIITAAFWSVLLVGIADAAISFVRIENMLPAIVGADLALSLGKPAFRGVYVHVPLIAMGALIAVFRRGIDFIWLAALIVFAELLIVITRFIFSYEQAFMGDLVRFWYAALFLFASAYTLIHDGHVRVDVLYASFEKKVKAKINIWGTLLLGGPLCWIVLTRGLWNDTSAFNLALLNFEVTQQGFGMYVKYIMSGFLIVFALSMLFQFSSFLVAQLNVLEQDESASENAPENVTG